MNEELEQEQEREAYEEHLEREYEHQEQMEFYRKEYEQERYDQFIKEENERNTRLVEQERNKDFNEDMEKCDNCGCHLNSHDYCPNCEY